jgi:hypothetical protein
MKIYRKLTKIFSALLILLIVDSPLIIAQSSIYTLKAGTKLVVRMDNEINSKVSNVDDTFTATVSEPLIIRNVELITVGTVIEGKIINVKSAASGNSNGNLEVKFETLRLPDEQTRAIEASLVKPISLDNKSSSFSALSILGGTGIGTILGAVIGKSKGALIGAGLGASAGTGAAFLKKGREARIKARQEFEIRLDKEVTLPIKDF